MNLFIISILYILLTGLITFGQVTQEWVARYNYGFKSYDIAYSIKVDGSGNVYVTGASPQFPWNYDYATIKYSSSGGLQWVARYNGPANGIDEAYSMAVDGLGNVFVTGQSYGNGTFSDYATIKYSPSGVIQWIRRYNGPGNNLDQAVSMALDDSGNVYVTGFSRAGSISETEDFTTIKYNSSGDSIWVRRYNGPGNLSDAAKSIAIDVLGNVYVTGTSRSSLTFGRIDYATIKYNSTGTQLWVAIYNGPVNYYDSAYSITVDNFGNVYVTGFSWGGSSDYDYATIKYNSLGVQQWVQRYNGPGNNKDQANSIAIDSSGNVYVTGVSYGNGTDSDYATIKYSSSGVQQWVQRYNGPGNSSDAGRSLAMDVLGNVYVTGSSRTGISFGTEDYTTIKYNSSGVQLWVQRYNGPINSIDVAFSITVDNPGNVYVTGTSNSSGFELYDYATVKYSQMTGIQPITSEIPRDFSLHQNYPNPFNPTTKIRFQIPVGAQYIEPVRLMIYDILGREVATLVNEQLKAGTYEVEWDGTNYPSGVYYYRLIAGDYSETKKMVLVK